MLEIPRARRTEQLENLARGVGQLGPARALEHPAVVEHEVAGAKPERVAQPCLVTDAVSLFGEPRATGAAGDDHAVSAVAKRTQPHCRQLQQPGDEAFGAIGAGYE